MLVAATHLSDGCLLLLIELHGLGIITLHARLLLPDLHGSAVQPDTNGTTFCAWARVGLLGYGGIGGADDLI